jgi:hydroxyacylglutathione hydrolase
MGYIPSRLAAIPADKPIVVHCQSGARSAIAASVLEALGRTQVWNYAGSYQDWARQGGPIEREALEPVPADG